METWFGETASELSIFGCMLCCGVQHNDLNGITKAPLFDDQAYGLGSFCNIRGTLDKLEAWYLCIGVWIGVVGLAATTNRASCTIPAIHKGMGSIVNEGRYLKLR
jgi:hypothetical protein